MTEEEVAILVKKGEEWRARKDKAHNVARGASTNKTVSFAVDQTLLEAFQEKVEGEGLTVSLVLRGAVLAYTFGGLKFSGDRLVSTAEAMRNTPEGFNRAHVPRETPTPKTDPLPKAEKKAPGRPKAESHLTPWHDQDHSNRPLKDFDYPDVVHRDADGRQFLKLDTEGKDGRTYEQVLGLEYDHYRELFDERGWQIEYWNFCRYVAKKFFTLNRLDLRYDEPFLQNDLYLLLHTLEAEHAFYVETKARWKAAGGVEIC